MSRIVLIHGGLWDEMDAERFWVRTGVFAALRAYGHELRALDRPRRAPSWDVEVTALTTDLPDGPLVVVGGSNGCTAAVRLASQADVSRLVLCWPATAGDASVDSAILSHEPGLEPLLAGETLRGVADAALARITVPVGIVPSVPANQFHQRSTVDSLLRLMVGSVELPGSPEPPHPLFDPAAFATAVHEFVDDA